MNKGLLLPVAVILCCSLFSAGFLLSPSEPVPGQPVNILMREIGHKVLHAAGDSVSRVMPISQVGENVFQISFEAPLTFEPDTLVKVVSSIMVAEGFRTPYVVNVIDVATSEVIYGFQIGRGKRDIVPCLGRNQPKGQYVLQVALLEQTKASKGILPSLGILGGGTLLALGLIFFFPPTARHRAGGGDPVSVIAIGSFNFQPDKGLLRRDDTAVELTVKESRVLAILSREINSTVLRDQLNVAWSDEGVITGRSLDVFVSKLRKRFATDPAIRIINVHGKGYRLEVANANPGIKYLQETAVNIPLPQPV